MKTLLMIAAIMASAVSLSARPATRPNVVTVQVPKQVHVVSGARIDVWITVYVAQQYLFWRGHWYPL